MNTSLLIGLVIASTNITLSYSVFAETSREMESVLTISADSAATLLSNDAFTEDVMFVSHEAASALLGNRKLGDSTIDTAFDIDQLNSLPTTAAGSDDIIFIDVDAAAMLLGDTP
ncbi:MAG: hypothetical protein JKY88_04835 [Pseudomonadales bacterium]|nr:hypothetical protein [Pseudomonadales bacterium]